MGVYTDITTGSRNPLKRFSHQRRYAIALKLLDKQPDDRILDYGSGPGHFCSMVGAVGYDPKIKHVSWFDTEWRECGCPTIYESLDAISGTFDKITCLETLEHLPAHEATEAISNIKALLKPGGLAIISVPIEIGPPALLKTIVRRQKLWKGIQSTFYVVPERPSKHYYVDHMGFDWRTIAAQLPNATLTFSPFPLLPSALNSQVYFTFLNV